MLAVVFPTHSELAELFRCVEDKFNHIGQVSYDINTLNIQDLFYCIISERLASSDTSFVE